MDQSPLISVIIPTYNRRQFLPDLMDCLKKQDFPSDQFEIIIVDDGSTDGTWELLRSWEAQHLCVCVRQDHQGPGAARNLGATISRGRILAFSDSDCLPESGWLRAFAGEYAEFGHPPASTVGGIIENLAQGSWLRMFQARRGTDHIANHHPSPLYLDTANASILKSAFLAVGGFHPAFTWSEDVDLGFRLRGAGIVLTTTPKAIVWHIGPRSLKEYLKRSYKIGYAKGRLALLFPDTFYPLPPPGIRRQIRRRLDRASRPSLVDPHQNSRLPAFFSRSCYSLAQIFTWEKSFWTAELPRQFRHYRQQHLHGILVVFYLCLEWLCHLAHMTGSAAYLAGFCLQPESDKDD